MLGKLMKHEWKSVYKVGCIMLLVSFVVTLISCIYFRSPMWISLFNEEGDLDNLMSVTWMLLGVAYVVLAAFLLIGTMYGMMIYLGVRFYKSMYTDEGYLTHTLPVSANQLLGSKVLIGGIWMLLMYIVYMLGIFAMMLSFASGILEAQQPGANFWQSLSEIMNEIVMMYESELGFDLVHYAVVVVLSIFLGAFSGMMMVYGAFTIGQLSKKYKLAVGILTLVGIYAIYFIIYMVMSMVSMAKSIVEMDNGQMTMNMNGLYDMNIILSIILSVVLYLLSLKIIKKKLNLN